MVVLLAVRFLAELGMLVALATVWGLWVAPKARRRLPDPTRLAVEVTLFAAAFLALQAGEASLSAMVAGVSLWAAFLISVPARGHELNQRVR